MKALQLDGILEHFFNTSPLGKAHRLVLDSVEPSTLLESLPSRLSDTLAIHSLDSSPVAPQHPFEPILSWFLKALEQNPTEMESVFEKMTPGFLHKELLFSWIKTGRGQRKEELQNDQKFYDYHEMLRLLSRGFFAALGGKPRLFFLSNAQNISHESLELLQYLWSLNSQEEFYWIIHLNTRTPEGEGTGEVSLRLQDYVAEENIPLFVLPEDTTVRKASVTDTFQLPPIEEYLLRAQNQLNFLDLHASLKNLDLCPLEHPLAMELKSDAQMMQGHFEEAIHILNQLLDKALYQDNKPLSARVYRKLGQAYVLKQNIEMAKKLIGQGLKMAKDLDDEVEIYKGETLYLAAVLGYAAKEEYQNLLQTFEKILLTGKKLKSWYVLARSCGNLVADNNVVTYGVLTEEGRMNWCNYGIRLAQKIKNDHLLGSLYHNKATILSNLGQDSLAIRHYKKSEVLKLKVGNPQEIIRLYNGFGYAHFSRGNWSNALEYYLKSFEMLKQVKDYVEICLTVFNMGETYFYAGQTELTLFYLNALVQLMRTLSIDKIPFHNIFEALVLIGISYAQLGNHLKAYKILATLQHNDQELNQKDKVLALHLESLLTPKDEVHQLVNRIHDAWEKVPAENEKNRLAPLLQKAEFKKPRKTASIPLKQVDFRPIFQEIQTDMALNKLHRKMRDIHFLNTLQQRLLFQSATEAEMMQEILSHIYDSFIAGVAILLRKKGESWNLHFHGTALNEGQKRLLKLLDQNPREHFQDKTDTSTTKIAGFEEYGSFIFLPIHCLGGIKGILFLATQIDEMPLDEEDFRVLALSARQIGTALDNRQLLEQQEDQNRQLEKTLEDLTYTQTQLIEAEKMASLGSLVAGVAHEINTPLGISITASTHLESISAELQIKVQSGQLRKSDLEGYLVQVQEGMSIMASNLHRAAELVQSFKQVAVDQSTDDLRTFEVVSYLQGIMTSLSPRFRQSLVKVVLEPYPEFKIQSHPGSFYKIVSNLVLNALVHGFEPLQPGEIHITVNRESKKLILKVSDDGLGMDEATRRQIFEPFFTTRRGRGGVGLGLSIVFNLVTHQLGGTIEVRSNLGEGSTFIVDIPTP